MGSRRRDIEAWMQVVIYFALLLWAATFLLSGCATQGVSQTSQGAVYKYDMLGSINGAPFDGVGVIPRADFYDVRIESRVDVDLLTITSCHRDVSVESAIQQGWFSTKRGYAFRYVPTREIESRGSCLLRFGAYNKDSANQNAWAIVDFEDPWTILKATNLCNGRAIESNGVSICQSRAGLVQAIEFPEPVQVAEKSLDARCRPTASEDKKTWTYAMPSGECVIAFQEIEMPYRRHRLTTIGYGQVLYRGN